MWRGWVWAWAVCWGGGRSWAWWALEDIGELSTEDASGQLHYRSDFDRLEQWAVGTLGQGRGTGPPGLGPLVPAPVDDDPCGPDAGPCERWQTGWWSEARRMAAGQGHGLRLAWQMLLVGLGLLWAAFLFLELCLARGSGLTALELALVYLAQKPIRSFPEGAAGSAALPDGERWRTGLAARAGRLSSYVKRSLRRGRKRKAHLRPSRRSHSAPAPRPKTSPDQPVPSSRTPNTASDCSPPIP